MLVNLKDKKYLVQQTEISDRNCQQRDYHTAVAISTTTIVEIIIID